MSEQDSPRERRQSPNGEWYLSPQAYEEKLGIRKQTRYYWREYGIPILEGEELATHSFQGGNGRMIDYYSESQAQRISDARRASVATADDLVRENVAAERCRISVNLVRRLAHAGVIESERRPVYKGGQAVKVYFVSLKGLREYLHRRKVEKSKAITIADPVSVAKAAKMCGVSKGTVNAWVQQGKIAHEALGHADRGGRRFVVSRSEALGFARKTLPSGDGEEWLYRFQISIQFPKLSFRTLEHYSIRKPKAYNVPPLGRPVKTRTVDRPPGLKCPNPRVHQWKRADISKLISWLETPKAPAKPYPTVQRAIAFIETYLADGKRHPLQDIIAATAEEGIKRQWLIAAVPHLKGLLREPVESKGKQRFKTWRLAQVDVMTGAFSVSESRRNGESRPKLDHPDPWMKKMNDMHDDIRGVRDDVRAVDDAVQKTPQQTAELVRQQITETTIATESPTDARGRWLYEQRTKNPPVPWKTIIKELSSIAKERGWELLVDEPTAATVLRRWCKDKGSEYPRQ